MRQFLPRSLALLVLSVFLVALAYAEGEKDKSPEDVFKAFVAAVKRDDVKTSMSYLTRDSQSAIAGFIIWMAAVSTPTLDKEKDKEARKDEDFLKRHGISEDALRKLPREGAGLFGNLTLDEFLKNLVGFGEMVKDKQAFVADVLKIPVQHEDLKTKEFFKGISEASIKDVRIEGQQAKGQVTMPSGGGKEETQTYYFKLENGIWKIDAIDTFLKMASPPPAPPAQVQRPAPPSYSRPGPLRRLLDRLRNW